MVATLLMLIISITNIVTNHAETHNCLNGDEDCTSPLICANSNDNCTITCSGTRSCRNFDIIISEATTYTFKIICSGNNACQNMNVLSYRVGWIRCDSVSDVRNATCWGADIRMIDRGDISSYEVILPSVGLDCYNDQCRDISFYCDYRYNCNLNCRGLLGCSKGTYKFYCKNAAYCTITGNTYAFIGVPSAILYCDPTTQGDSPSACNSTRIPVFPWEWGGTLEPTSAPTDLPTIEPTFDPTKVPSYQPTEQPTIQPTDQPSLLPTFQPTYLPTIPTVEPSNLPTQPTTVPSYNPTTLPSDYPTVLPTVNPSGIPSVLPTGYPAHLPTLLPSYPTAAPSILITDDGGSGTGTNNTSSSGGASSNYQWWFYALVVIIILLIIVIMYQYYSYQVRNRNKRESSKTNRQGEPSYKSKTKSKDNNNNNAINDTVLLEQEDEDYATQLAAIEMNGAAANGATPMGLPAPNYDGMAMDAQGNFEMIDPASYGGMSAMSGVNSVNNGVMRGRDYTADSNYTQDMAVINNMNTIPNVANGMDQGEPLSFVNDPNHKNEDADAEELFKQMDNSKVSVGGDGVTQKLDDNGVTINDENNNNGGDYNSDGESIKAFSIPKQHSLPMTDSESDENNNDNNGDNMGDRPVIIKVESNSYKVVKKKDKNGDKKDMDNGGNGDENEDSFENDNNKETIVADINDFEELNRANMNENFDDLDGNIDENDVEEMYDNTEDGRGMSVASRKEGKEKEQNNDS